MTKFYGEIRKVDEEQRMVYGTASTTAVDSQGEVITKACMQEAWDDYMKFANVREMHQPSAVGIVKEYAFTDDGVEVGIHVVDDSAWEKVKAGVYKGLSVGGSKVKGGYDAITKTISKMVLKEISLVDRPSNPEALITVFKCDDANDDDAAVAKSADPVAATITVPPEAAATVEALAELLNKGDIDPARLLELAKADKGKDEGEYGDVAYADTKNKTYPIDTEKHIRAAWSYINMPKNQAGYTDDEVKAIKGRIVSAWKKVIDDKGPASADEGDAKKSDGADDIKKGMYDISEFARVLCSVGYLMSSAAQEAIYEGDNSPLPAAMKEWFSEGVAIFNSYVKEETDELLAALPQPKAVVVETVALADVAADVRKSLDGVGEDLESYLSIAKAHMPAMDVARIITADGFAAATEAVIGKVDGGISKMAAERDDAIAKVAALESRITELEARPAPAKAILRVVVEKGRDIPSEDAAAPVDDTVHKADGTVDGEATALAMIKKAHQSGGSRPAR